MYICQDKKAFVTHNNYKVLITIVEQINLNSSHSKLNLELFKKLLVCFASDSLALRQVMDIL